MSDPNVFTEAPKKTRKTHKFYLRRARLGKAGYRGVVKSGAQYRAVIGTKGTSHNLGSFDTAKEAAQAYDAAARQRFGQNALLNFPMVGELGAAGPSLPPLFAQPQRPIEHASAPVASGLGAGDVEAFRYGEAEQLFEMCGDMMLTMLSRLFETDHAKEAFAELREQVAGDFSKASFANAFCVAVSATRMLARKHQLIDALRVQVQDLRNGYV